MRHLYTLLRLFSVAILFFGLSRESQAQSYTSPSGALVGTNFYYENASPYVYNLFYEVYIDASNNTSHVNPLNMLKLNCNSNGVISTLLSGGQVNISDVCADSFDFTQFDGGTIKGRKKITYTGTIDLSSEATQCPITTIRNNSQRRAASTNVTTSAGPGGFMITPIEIFSLNDSNNSSARFAGIEMPYVCAGTSVTYDPLISDPDGDSLVVSLTSALRSAGATATPVIYLGGATAASPIPGITINSQTGVLNFTAPASGDYVVTYKVDEYDPATGLQVGSVMKEFRFFIVSTCSNVAPVAAVALSNLTGSAVSTGAYAVTLTSGSAGCFRLNYTDAQSISDYFSSATGVLPGSTFNTTNGEVCWTPTSQNAGTYTITIGASDDACLVTGRNTKEIQVTVINLTPPLAIDSVSVSDETCFGFNDGQLVIHTSGGVGPFEYQVINVFGPTVILSQINNNTFTGLADNSYTINVIDQGDGNNTVSSSADVQGGDPLTVPTFNGLLNSCFGSCTGNATANHSPNVAGITYLWNNGETTKSATSLCQGINSVTVTNGTCSQTNTVTINSNPQIFVTLDSTHDVSCNGLSDGGLFITPSGGTVPINTYTWSNASTSQDLTGVPQGSYSVTVTDNIGCQDSLINQSVDEPVALSVSFTFSNPDCNGASTGSALAIPTGGTGPYTFVWSANASSQTTALANNLPAGTFSVTVTDTNNCTATNSQALINPTALNISIQLDSNVSCNGGNDGSLTAIVSGGTGAYSFLWSNADADSIAGGLTQGTYNVTVTDANGCTADTFETIAQPSALILSVDSTDISCPGNTDGMATAVVTLGTGTAPYTFEWSTGATGPIISSLAAGTYTVTAMDANNCTITGQTIVNGAGPAITFNIQLDSNASCNGLSDGSLTVVNVQNATSPLSFSWAHGDTDSIAQGLGQGTYFVTVTDNDGCAANDNAAITEPAIIDANIVVDDSVSCNGASDGGLTVQGITGGTGAYSFAWSSGVPGNTASVTGLSAGAHTVTVTDVNGCSATFSETLTEPTVLSATVYTPPILVGFNYIGEYEDKFVYYHPASQTWTAARITSQGVGGDLIVISDAADQAYFSSVLPGNSWIGLSDEVVEGTYVWVDGTVATFFNWNVGEPNNFGGDEDYVHFTGANDFWNDLNQFASRPYGMVIDKASFNLNNVSCNGGNDGSVIVTGAGGTTPYTYSWSNGQSSDTAVNLIAGTYIATVTDSKGCTATDTAIISEPDPIIITMDSVDISCAANTDGVASVFVNPLSGTAPFTYAWSNGGTTDTIIGLAAGTYTVTVTDANLCLQTGQTTVNGSGAPISFTISLDSNVSCTGGSDGSLTVTNILNASLPYSFAWAHGDNDSIAGGLVAGMYYVTITDGNLCSANDSFEITEPASLPQVFSAITQPVLCAGDSTGSITASGVGGTAPYSFVWSEGSSANAVLTHNVSLLPAGTYNITMTDANGCISNDVRVLTPGDALDLVPTVSMVSCAGSADGSITLNPISSALPGPANFTFVWSIPGTSNSQTGLAAGSYSVTLTNTNSGCTIDSTFVITESDTIKLTMFGSDLNCYQDASGIAAVAATGGTGTLSYSWNTAGTTDTIIGLDSGMYYVTVTDINLCTANDSVAITQPIKLIDSVTVTQPILCFGGTDGEATVFHNGGIGSIFNWSSGSAAITATGLSAGTYFVTVTDAGCSFVDSVELTQPTDTVAPAIVFSQAPICNGGSDGIIVVTATGGTLPYTYTWSAGGSTIDTANNLAPGSYTITVSDLNGCSSAITETLINPVLLTSTDATTNAACFGPCDGTATSTASGGTGPYTYVWNTGATVTSTGGSTLTSLCGDSTYSVTITDAVGCQITRFITVDENFAPNVTIAGTNATCATSCNGSATSTPVFFFGTREWRVLGSPAVIGTGANITGLCPNTTYIVTYTTILGCSSSETVFIDSPDALEIQMDSLDATCGAANGSAVALVIGGTPPYSYSWAGSAINNDTLSGLSAGVYPVTVTDANLCTIIDSVEIIEPSNMILSFIGQSAATCQDGTNGSAEVIVTGGTANYTYAWDNGETSAVALSLDSGMNSVTVTDANLCIAVDSVLISDGEPILISFTETSITCSGLGNDGEILADATGGNGALGFTYAWDNGGLAALNTGLVAGTYKVVVTDVANGCQDSNTYILNPPSAFTVTMIDSADVLCNGDTNGMAVVQVTNGSGNYTYAWTSGEIIDTAFALWAGAHKVIVNDITTGCVDSALVTIDEPALLVAVIDSVDTNTCFGGTEGIAYSSATGGTGIYSFIWPNGDIAAFSDTLAAGSYIVTVSDINGCTDTAIAVITEPATGLSVIASTDSNVSCFGLSDGGASATAAGGSGIYTYSWPGGLTGPSVNGLSQGSYIVTVSDGGTCTAVDTAIITQPTQLAGSSTETQAITCLGGGNDGELTAAGSDGTPPYNFEWSNGVFTAVNNNLIAGIYTVTITDFNDCFIIINDTITNPVGVIATIVDSSDVLCNGDTNGTAVVHATNGSGNFTYAWTSGESIDTAFALWAGAHQVTVTDVVSGCSDIATVTIDEPSILIVIIDSVDTNSCFGGTEGVAYASATGGTLPYSFAWPNGDAAAFADTLAAGSYIVTVTDLNGCSNTATAVITEPATGLSVLATTDSNVTCFDLSNGGATAVALGGTGIYTYTWPGGLVGASQTGLSAGSYIVTVTDGGTCNAVDTAIITEPTELIGLTVSAGTPSCPGASDATAQVVGAGGTPGYTYVWESGTIGANETGLADGNYSVTITDLNNCVFVHQVTINDPAGMGLSQGLFTSTDCLVCNGSATVLIGGTSPSYTFDWGNGEILNPAVALCGGINEVTVTDASGCIDSISFNIPNNGADTIVAGSTQVACFGDSSGTAFGTYNLPCVGCTVNWFDIPAGNLIATGDTAFNLPAGEFIAQLTNGAGCIFSDTAIITQPATSVIASIVGSTNVNCLGGSDGTATVDVIGGTGFGTYTYLWDNGQTTELATGLSQGTHCVTATDANGCSDTACIFIDQPATGLSVIASVVQEVQCVGTFTGDITADAAGGSGGPYTYTWTGLGNGKDQFNLGAGTYIVQASDGGICTAMDTVTLVAPAPIIIVLDSFSDPSCPTLADGFAGVTATGGTGILTYLWPSGNTGQVENGLAANTYIVTVTDGNLCTGTQNVLIQDPAGMVSGAPTGVSNASCTVCDGVATLNITGGTLPHTYLWFNLQTGITNDSLCGGLNSVTITDAVGCEITTNVLIDDDGADTVFAASSDASCGACDGEVFATYNCNVAPCSVTWKDAGGNVIGNTDTITGLCAGDYTVELTNGLGCTDVEQTTIQTPPLFDPGVDSIQITCFGACDGSISFIPTGGSGVFNYAWSNGAGNVSAVNGLCAGTYTITVSDPAGCDSIVEVTLTEPSQIASNATIDSASCGGVCDGAIQTSPTPNSGLYSYNWSPVPANGNGMSMATGLCAGTYFLTITNATGCNLLDTFVVEEPTPITLDSIDVVNTTCGDSVGIAFIQAVGGTGVLSYEWSTGAIGQTATSLYAFLHEVTVTDATGCFEIFSVPVSDIGGPAISISSINVSVFGADDGSASVVFSNPPTPLVTYNWSNGDTNQTADTLIAGFYSVTVTDGLGCESIDTVTITEPTLLDLSFLITEISCSGNGCDGEITALVTGGVAPYSFLWNTGDTTATIDSLCSGTYTVTMTDANSAEIILPVILNDPSGPTIIPNITDASCNGLCDGIIDLTVLGGSGVYAYVWSNGDTSSIITGLCAGPYSVTVTDTTGCLDTLSVVIDEPDAILTTILAVIKPTCPVVVPDGSIEVGASGGEGGPFAFEWLNAQFAAIGQTTSIASNLSAGIYNVQVQDQSTGCLDTTTIILNSDNAADIALDSINNVSCFGLCDGEIFTTITGGVAPLSIIWSSGGTNDDEFNLCAGADTIQVIDADGCYSADIFEITEPTEIELDQLNVTAVICGSDCNGIIDISISGGTSPYTYTWSNGANTDSISGLCAGVYDLTVTDDNGCTFLTSVTVGGPIPMIIDLDTINQATCNNTGDGSVLITVTGGNAPYTYHWIDTAANVITTQDLLNVQAGLYILNITDAIGCIISDTFTVGAKFAVSVKAQADTTVCPATFGMQVTGTSIGASTLRWINGQGIILGNTITAVVDALQDTNMFVLEGTNSLCVSRDTMFVFHSGGTGIDAGPNKIIEPGESVTIGGSPTVINGIAVTWSPANDDISSITNPNPEVYPLQTKVFYVTATSTEGCIGLDSVTVTVEKLVDPVGGFSPNGDGINDNFFIDKIGNYPNAIVQILNRWGNEIFVSAPGYTNPWDGTLDGNKLPHGAYYYVIDLKDGAAPDPITGSVTILK